MPGAYPSDPVPGPSQPAAAAVRVRRVSRWPLTRFQLRRHRTREELRREREELRNGLGLLENALQEISNKEPDAPDDDDAAKTPTPPTPRPHKHARPRTTNNSNNRRGHRKNASRRVYVGNVRHHRPAGHVLTRYCSCRARSPPTKSMPASPNSESSTSGTPAAAEAQTPDAPVTTFQTAASTWPLSSSSTPSPR